jgi:hypothetical protein
MQDNLAVPIGSPTEQGDPMADKYINQNLQQWIALLVTCFCFMLVSCLAYFLAPEDGGDVFL